MHNKIWRFSLLFFVLTIVLGACSLPWKKAAPLDSGDAPTPPAEEAPAISYSGEVKGIVSASDWLNLIQAKGQGLSLSEAKVSSTGLLWSSPSGTASLDVLKSEGQYLYALSRSQLYIFSYDQAGAVTILSRTEVSPRPTNLAVSGASLVLIGPDDRGYPETIGSGRTFIQVFDVSDPTQPKRLNDFSLSGEYLAAEQSGDYLYLLTEMPSRDLSADAYLAPVFASGQKLSADCALSVSCYSPSAYYFDLPYEPSRFFILSGVNIHNSSQPLSSQAFLVSASQDAYLSGASLYITYPASAASLEQELKHSLVDSDLPPAEKAKLGKIEAAEDYILSRQEKLAKAGIIIDRFLAGLDEANQALWQDRYSQSLAESLQAWAKTEEKTTVYKFSLAGGKASFQARAEVLGEADAAGLNEAGGYLYLASRRSQAWSAIIGSVQKRYSNVYVFDENLAELGKLQNIASDFPLFAAHLYGRRLYLEMSDRSAPIYAVDLSDPSKPVIAGAVKLTATYSVIRPLNAAGDSLLALGQAEGSGLKVSWFDFSNLSQPKEAASYIIGDASSRFVSLSHPETIYYDANSSRLVLPAAFSGSDGRLEFSGALIFSADQSGLTLKQRVDHSAGGNFADLDAWSGASYYDNTVRRSLAGPASIFTLSNKLFKSSSLADGQEVSSLMLIPGGEDKFIQDNASSTLDVPEPGEGSDDIPAEEIATSSEPSL